MADPHLPTWNTHEAKDNLSKLLAEAQHKEQVILRYGKPFAVVIGYDEYLSKGTGSGSAWEVFKGVRLEETLNPPERSEPMRDVEL